jgi:YidC/Oxa1 family membrane protein insertase
MDNLRVFLWLTLAAMLWLNYVAWDRYFAEPATEQTVRADGDDVPALPAGVDELPELSPGVQEAGETGAPTLPSAPQNSITVRTDVLDLVIDLRGGDLVRADLPLYPVDKDRPDVPVRLLDYNPGSRWVFQTGLRDAAGGDEPNHIATFRAEQGEYRLADGQDELVVVLHWEHEGDVAARKVYTFRRGEYRVGLTLELENTGDAPWRGAAYAQMLREHRPPSRSLMRVDSYSFTGPVLYDGSSYDKIRFNDIQRQPVTQTLPGGWLASIQHHFLAAAVPPPDEEISYRVAVRGAEDYVATALSGVREIPPGGSMEYPFQLFVGPKLQSQLSDTAPGLELTVDYGFLTILAQSLFWVLSWIYGFVGNWGWSIIIVTFLIKLVFYKLTQTSGRSMAKMRNLAPRLKALQERYKDDRQKLSQAMMDLYKKEKVNPAAGCLPILIQMPFFFAFYWVLIESVEMRQAPFLLWLNDLSSRDPYFVLPLLMGAAMFLQMRLNPLPPDPMQARIMQIMPIVFTVFFAFFPSGLVLYWLTNTVLSMAQQWRINKSIAAQPQSG